jgi:hypothetical protein
LRDGRRLEKDSERQINHQRAADHTDHMDRQQRVAAEVEEIVMKTDAIALEAVGADPGEELFERAGWRDIASAVAGLGAGRRQGSAVELAVGGERQCARITKADVWDALGHRPLPLPSSPVTAAFWPGHLRDLRCVAYE